MEETAQLQGCESFAEGVELADGVADRAITEQTGGSKPFDSCLESGEGVCRGRVELVGELRRGERPLHRESEQGWVFDSEATEDGDAGLDQVGGRIGCRRERRDRGPEELEGSRPERDDEAPLRPEEAVDGAGRRPDLVRDSAHRESLESIALDDPLGRVEQRARGSFCVSSRTAHLTRNRNDVTLLPDSVTPYRKRGEKLTTVDWSLGHYEHSAYQLLPAAEVVVERAMPVAGERVVDVGCGTGNAALLAAARGARVTGVDPARRLLEVAREQAAARGLEVMFLPGEAAALPLPEASADVVLSVFGVIFAPNAQAATAELARVTAAGGRIVLSAWIPIGAISETNRLARETVMRALGAPAAPPPFPWHDHDALADLFAPHGFSVSVDEHSLSFTAASASDYLDTEYESHPLAVAGRAVLEPRGEAEALRARALEILEAANEDPAGFRVTNRYVVATAERT